MTDGNLQPTTTTSTKGADQWQLKSAARAVPSRPGSTSKKPAPKAGSSGAKSKSTLNAGAQKGGSGGRYVFDLYDIERIAAGGNAGSKQHYANTRAALVEGKNVQVGLAFEKRGCGARPHTHPNEQFNFVVKGTLKVDVGDKKGMLVPTGSVAYFPANVVHRSIATPRRGRGVLRGQGPVARHHRHAGGPSAKAARISSRK
jgi:quercetin dioxygenase-like cupin family protein